MTRSDKDEYEGDNEADSEMQEAESASDEDEHLIEDFAQSMKIGSAKNEGHEDTSEDAEEESSTLSQEQIDTVRNLCEDQVPFEEIGIIMGIPEGTMESYELRRVFVIANTMLGQSMNAQGEYVLQQPQIKAGSENWRRKFIWAGSFSSRGGEL